MASESRKLHFILFPLMAPGHMIPMIDIAKLLAQRGVIVTIITTPLNANRITTSIHRATESGLEIRIPKVRFPSSEAGLPEGCENLDSLPSMDLASNFFVALNLLQDKVEKSLEELKPRPNCMISDMGLPWTTQIAEKFQIPRIIFHGTCCFSLLCSHNIVSSKILDTLSSGSDQFEVPNLHVSIRLRKSQVTPSTNRDSSTIKAVTEQIRAAEKTSFGVVVNTFQELEAEYVKQYSKTKGERVWCIGPVSLCNNKGADDLLDRGKKASTDCSKRLDSHEPRSVIYASLGSLSRLITAQMIELAMSLEESNMPFIWALGGGDKAGELERWILENGFEERVNGRGLVIRGWAPQLLILSHGAIGGFLTHAGWNSAIEGISSGVPMVTWPLFAEQFVNEKLVVEVLRIGVSVGVEVPVKWGEEEKVGVLVKRDDVKRALERVMGAGESGEERRRRAWELRQMAKKAVDDGGSSYGNLTALIQEIMERSSFHGTD